MQMSIDVLAVNRRSGVSRKTGEAYNMASAECVFHSTDPETGAARLVAGEMMLPRGQEDIQPGRYVASMIFRRNREGRIEAGIAKLVPSVADTKASRAA